MSHMNVSTLGEHGTVPGLTDEHLGYCKEQSLKGITEFFDFWLEQ